MVLSEMSTASCGSSSGGGGGGGSSGGYMQQNTGYGHVVVMEHTTSTRDKLSSKKKMQLFKKIKKRFGLVRQSPSSYAGPPLQFHSVHGDSIRISRDGTCARRFESYCRAITFSARPIRINERVCVKFNGISYNWNGGIRIGFTNNDPATLEHSLPKYLCPDLTHRPGFWGKAVPEQYCEKENILFYYVNTAGNVIYGINNEEKGILFAGVNTRGLLWTMIDIYGNCTAIEFVDARLYINQQDNGCGSTANMTNNLAVSGGGAGPQMAHTIASSHHPPPPSHQQPRRSLPSLEHELERQLIPSLQSLNLSNNAAAVAAAAAEHAAIANDIANGLPPLRYNANGRLIPVPFHITKGRNVRLSLDRFIAARTETDFCQGYVFTARPIRIGEKVIVQVLKTEQMYVGALALGLTSCNPASLQPSDLPNDSDFLLDRPEYWVVSKDIASTPQRGDEIAFHVAPNGEVTISKNNGPAVVVMHVDQSLQLWAFLDVYGSTQSVRMFRQQLPNMVAAAYPSQLSSSNATCSSSSTHLANMPTVSESMNSLNSQISESRKLLHPTAQQLNVVTHSVINNSSASLASMQAHNTANNSNHNNNSNNSATSSTTTSTTTTTTGRMISVPSNGDILQIQPNGGGTVLVVNLPPPAASASMHDLNGALSVSQARISSNQQSTMPTTAGVIAANATCSSGGIITASTGQYIDTSKSMVNGQSINKWGAKMDTVDHHHQQQHGVISSDANTSANGSTSANAECTICYENQIDSVLYMCGHMCMCYNCAIQQWRGVGGGQCPLCRAIIRDVIRTYTT